MTDRLDNGVRARADGEGDAWAKEHRRELGNAFYLNDIDAMMGHMAFAQNSTDQLFAEYMPDRYENRGKIIRTYCTIAFFDRKKSTSYRNYSDTTISAGYYLDLCRKLGKCQPIAPKFFYIVGIASPWTMIEVDINSGVEGKAWTLTPGQWPSIWEAAGLKQMRDRLKQWLETGK